MDYEQCQKPDTIKIKVSTFCNINNLWGHSGPIKFYLNLETNMKKLLAAILLASVSVLPVKAEVLGLDWKLTANYNLTDELSQYDIQAGKTIDLGGLSFTADLDYDISASAFMGSDYKLAMEDAFGVSGLELYGKTGLDVDWKKEDYNIGMVLEF